MWANPRVGGGLSRKDSKSRGKQDHVPLKLSRKSKHCFSGVSLGYIRVGAFLLNPTRSSHFFSFFSQEDLILCDIDISPLEHCLPHISGFLLPLSSYDMFSTQTLSVSKGMVIPDNSSLLTPRQPTWRKCKLVTVLCPVRPASLRPQLPAPFW